MKTLSYILGAEQEIEVGAELYFGQLWDGDGDGEELLNSSSVCLGEDKNRMPVIVAFEIVERDEDILNTVVRVADIY